MNDEHEGRPEGPPENSSLRSGRQLCKVVGLLVDVRNRAEPSCQGCRHPQERADACQNLRGKDVARSPQQSRQGVEVRACGFAALRRGRLRRKSRRLVATPRFSEVFGGQFCGPVRDRTGVRTADPVADGTADAIAGWFGSPIADRIADRVAGRPAETTTAPRTGRISRQ